MLDTVEKQKVKEVTELLQRKYGRTMIEKLEELMTDWERNVVKKNGNNMMRDFRDKYR